jgi:hypothetical protein
MPSGDIGQGGSIRCVRQNHVKSLRDPLTDCPHQEVSTELVNATSAVEADDAVTTGKQDHQCAGFLSSEEEHPLGPAGDR